MRTRGFLNSHMRSARTRISVHRAFSFAVNKNDASSALRGDIRMLGSTLGNIIKLHDPEVFTAVEELRSYSRKWRNETNGNTKSFDKMVEEVSKYDTEKLTSVCRAFTHFLALSNSAENHHRARRLRQRMIEADGALSPKEDSMSGAVRRLLDVKNIPKDDVYDSLCKQKVEIVLTAHPTEVNRRTMLQKHSKIKEILTALDREDQTPYSIRELKRELSSEIASIWETDELRRSKPSPVEEAQGGMHVVADVLWYAVPEYLRKVDDVCQMELGKSLPLHASPIKLSSWMGGDRDGNPNVTPSITQQVAANSRHTAAKLFLQDIKVLHETLSLQKATQELIDITKNSREPYRYVLRSLKEKLIATKKWAENGALLREANDHVLTSTEQLLEPLLMLHRSLVSIGRPEIANGKLVDTIRRLSAFGLSMMELDIRQESTRHSEALDAITQHLNIGSYLEWDEEKRRSWLSSEIASNRPLLPKNKPIKNYAFTDTVVDTLETFEMIANMTEGSLGAYVISQCQQASDVLAVRLLQQDAGVQNPMRVVPLFETLADLERSAVTVEALFGIDVYKKCIKGQQEIMVGYSDSAKDAGRLAASWAQYNCQVEMADIAKRNNIECTFFHGKGGTVGRGGNPQLYHAIVAHPPGTINGRFRVTEQGEMITQNFGSLPAAERTLDLMTTGVLAEKYEERPIPTSEWRDTMSRLSDVSCKAYRQVVREEPRFVPYFRTATPELELSGLNVGSRPAKRNPKGGVESLRAIPWIFSWTQTRLNLPAWLGVGHAFNKEIQDGNQAKLQGMYTNWPWFRTVVNLLEMILAKSELKIAENYDKQLVTDKESLELGIELREKMTESVVSVLAVTGKEKLQSDNPVLLRSMEVRNPYVDPLNIIQAELLKRARSSSHSEEETHLLNDALLITINGVAAGMRNSG
jgi:phosphoenolpyruvate carboxylase